MTEREKNANRHHKRTIMAGDKEIRQFIKDNAPQIVGNERFMAELVRQIELLPVPAALSGKSEEEIRSAKALIVATARKIKRHNRIMAVAVAMVSVALLGALLSLYYFSPDVRTFVQQYFVYVSIGFSAVVLAAALTVSSLRRI